MRETQLSPWMHRHSPGVFWTVAALSLLVMVAALVSGYWWWSALPLICLSGLLFIVQPRWLFFSLVLVLPVSMEYELGSFSTDLPSEPLAILLAGLSMLWLLQQRFQKVKDLIYHPFSWILALHLLWVMICTPLAQNPVISLKYLLSKSWYIFGFFVGTYWISKNTKAIHIALITLVTVTTLTVAFVMTEHSPHGFTFDSINPACNPLYRNHVTYGVFLAMTLPLLLYVRSLTLSGRLNRLFANGGLILMLAGIYFSYTRGAWLALPVMIAVYIATKRKWLKYLIPVGLLAVIIFFVSIGKDYQYLKYAPNYETTIYHDELTDHLSATLQGEDMSTMERFHRWIAAFRMSREFPIVGVGPNNFVSLYQPYTVSAFETYISDNEERSTVHNYFILMMAEQGIPGLIIALLLASVFFIYGEHQYHLLKTPEKKDLYMALLLCGSAFWFNNLFSDLLEANKLAPLWLISCAWMVRIGQHPNPSEEHLV
jgi:O-antigen ligase